MQSTACGSSEPCSFKHKTVEVVVLSNFFLFCSEREREICVRAQSVNGKHAVLTVSIQCFVFIME